MKKDFNSGKIVRQTGMSPEQYFQKLDSLLKRNKGYGMTIARDTGTNIPLNLTSTATPARMPELSGGIAAQQLADQAAARTQTRQVQQQTIPEYRSREEMAGDVMGASDFSNITTPQQFNDALSQIFNRRVSDPNVLGGTLPANKQSLYGYNPYPGQNWSPNSQESIDNGLPFPALLPFEQGRKQYGRSTFLSGNEIYFPDGNVGTLNSNDGAIGWEDIAPERQSLVGGAPFPESQDKLIQQVFKGKRKQDENVNEVGEYYGLPGEEYNTGLDIGTGDDSFPTHSPFAGKVVGRTYSQYGGQAAPGDYSEANGYGWGNSVEIELPNGWRMRYAHLSETPLNVGDSITPNSFIGISGESGNTYGKHLDLTFRNQNGQEYSYSDFLQLVASSPSVQQELMGYTGKAFPQNQNSSNTADTGMRFSELGSAPIAQNDPRYTPEPQSIPEVAYNTAGNAFESMKDAASQVPQKVADAGQVLGESAANTIDLVNPTGRDFDLGLTEMLRGDYGLSEEKRADTARNVSRGVADIGNIFKLPELGLSEGLNKLADTIDPKVYAAEIEQPQTASQLSNSTKNNNTSQTQQIQGGLDTLKRQASSKVNQIVDGGLDMAKDTAYKAGEGINALKEGISGIADVDNIFKKINPSKMSGNKIGESGVGGDGPSNLASPNLLDAVKNIATGDIRDAFFKAGGANVYKDFLKPGIDSAYRGALDLNIFKDTFFQEPNRVANTFASTHLAKPATEKYRKYIYDTYPVIPGHDKPTYRATARGRYEDGTEWSVDYDEVDPIYYQNQYNQSVRNSVPAQLKSDFKFTAPVSTKAPKSGVSAPSLQSKTSNISAIESKKAMSSPSLAQAYTQTQSSPALYSTNKASGVVIPSSKNYSVPSQQKMSSIPSSGGVSAPPRSTPSAPSSPGPSRPSAPPPAPTPTPAPKSVAPTYQAPRSTPVQMPISSQPNKAPSSPVKSTPKPAAAPSKNNNVFTSLVNAIKKWF